MIETEARWRSERAVDETAILRILEEGGHRIETSRASLIDDSYFDTAYDDLARGGSGLRKRIDGERTTCEWKAEIEKAGAVQVREEIGGEVPRSFFPATAADLPEALRDHVLPFTGAAPLVLSVRLENERTVRSIVHVLSGARATLAIDRWTATANGRTTGPVFEVELEWETAGEDLFRDAALVLGARAGLTAAPDSKLAFALDFFGRARAFDLSARKSPAGVWWKAAMERRFRRVAEEESRFRLGQTTDEVHDLRVAVRRLRASVRAASVHASVRVPETFDAFLSMHLAVLGRVRDDDVLLENLTASAAPADRMRAAQRSALIAHLVRRREASARRALEFFRRSSRIKRWTSLKEALLYGAAKRGADPSGDLRIGVVAPGLLIELFRKTKDSLTEAQSGRSPLTWHKARIRARALRYLADDFRPLFGKRLVRFVESLKKNLDLSGRLQDLAASRDLLAAIAAAERGAPKRAREGAGYFAVTFWNEIDGLEAEAAEVWSRFAAEAAEPFARGIMRD